MVLVSRITLGIRSAFYGPAQLDEHTVNGIPLGELETTQSAQIPQSANNYSHWKETRNTQNT